ncbi:MAG: hypothetical protein JWP97_5334 [Labilithrix sp.]|nr:hypothetical protein [Labilithrix sp.]
MTTRTLLVTGIALVIGLIVGFLAGRFTLERQWSKPYVQVTPQTEQKSAGDNPSPKAGTKVLRAMPLAKSREALRTMTEGDAVVSHVAAFGAGDEGVELHVVVENHAACTLKSLEGVAYGFDARGKPSAVLAGGENFVAFSSSAPIAPGKKAIVSANLKNAHLATLAIAQIDKTTCTDGTSWARR